MDDEWGTYKLIFRHLIIKWSMFSRNYKIILTFNFTDVENAEAKFDLAIRSNKWEGEDEDEDVKVLSY